MTKEEKQLLLADLSARLPYGTKVDHFGTVRELLGVIPSSENVMVGYDINDYEASVIEDIKPYLRPMSSMTEEEFEKLKEYSGLKYEQLDLASYQSGTYKCLDFYLSEVPSYVVILVFDWLNVNHFDYRGLIERGLAIEVTEENNPYET